MHVISRCLGIKQHSPREATKLRNWIIGKSTKDIISRISCVMFSQKTLYELDVQEDINALHEHVATKPHFNQKQKKCWLLVHHTHL